MASGGRGRYSGLSPTMSLERTITERNVEKTRPGRGTGTGLIIGSGPSARPEISGDHVGPILGRGRMDADNEAVHLRINRSAESRGEAPAGRPDRPQRCPGGPGDRVSSGGPISSRAGRGGGPDSDRSGDQVVGTVSREAKPALHRLASPDDAGRDPARPPRDLQPKTDVAAQWWRKLGDEPGAIPADVEQASRALPDVGSIGPEELGPGVAGRMSFGVSSVGVVHFACPPGGRSMIDVPAGPIARGRPRVQSRRSPRGQTDPGPPCSRSGWGAAGWPDDRGHSGPKFM
jgi:hypothetical protein